MLRTDSNVNKDPATTACRKHKIDSKTSRKVANLTPGQLEKKRASDRKAQRAVRKRTKSRITALEQQVRILASQDPVLYLQATLQRNEQIMSQNQSFRQGLSASMRIIQPLFAKLEIASKLNFYSHWIKAN